MTIRFGRRLTPLLRFSEGAVFLLEAAVEAATGGFETRV
jgi:hypothetical protein